MTEQAARAVADALDGQPWQSGGGVWLVLLLRSDDHVVVISGDAVCEYASQEAFDLGIALSTIVLH